MAIPNPLINGNRYDWSSVVVKINGEEFGGIKEINYSQSLEPGEMRGTRAQVTGRGRGKYNAEGDITFYDSDFYVVAAALDKLGGGDGAGSPGPAGMMEVSFDITVSRAEAVLGTVTDVLQGCRLKKIAPGGSEGGDLMVVKCDLHVMALLLAKLPPMGTRQYLRP